MFQQFLQTETNQPSTIPKIPTWQQRQVQERLHLKGKVTSIYSQLLAQLRYKVIQLENSWLATGLLKEAGDIFYLEFSEIQALVTQPDSGLRTQIAPLIDQRKNQFQENQSRQNIPFLVWGNTPPISSINTPISGKYLQGIGASPGEKIGIIKILRRLEDAQGIDRNTILVVPYTDSGWSIVLSQAGGIIAEVGGRLSHGAILAREYKIPAVMDIAHATRVLKNGQQVRLDGTRGIVEMLR
jgi:pyruvate,water dikinase